MVLTAKASFAGHSLPSLLPKRIVSFDESGKINHFRIETNRYGEMSIKSQSELTPFRPGQSCLVCVDPQLLFRRKCSLTINNRNDLSRLATDFFPFKSPVHFALEENDDNPGQRDIYAMTSEYWNDILPRLPAVAAAVIPAPSDPRAIGLALEQRLYKHKLNDFLERPRMFVPPAVLACFRLVVLCAAIASIGMLLWRWQTAHRAEELRTEIAALESEVGEPKSRFAALTAMRDTIVQMDNFARVESGIPMMAMVSKMIQSLPEGFSIDRIEFKDGRLQISGLGKNPQNWLLAMGFKSSDIQINPLSQYQRYVASMAFTTEPANNR